MKPRRILFSEDFFEVNKLDVNVPSSDSLFFELWNENFETAKKALATSYIQGIRNGVLDPIVYGSFMVNDAYYCYHGAANYLNAANKTNHPVLKAFLLKKYHSYNEYNQTFSNTWRLQDASGVRPLEPTKKYADFEQEVALRYESIYTLIVMIPCEYLWYWLASQIEPMESNNLYVSWGLANNDPKGAYAMGNFLENYVKHNGIDKKQALEIYSKAIQYELENFIAATEKI